MIPSWLPTLRKSYSKLDDVAPRDYNPDWYRESFDEDYERIYRHTNDTAPREVTGILRYLGLSARPRDSEKAFLDVGCGWGRHAVRLASRGYRVMGVDLSAVMLREAMQNADAQKIEATYIDGVAEPDAVGNRGAARLTFVRCDMRQLKCDGEFDYAINIFTSFGYFVDEAENRRVLQGIRSALKPGGKLVIDVDNPLQYVRRRVGSTYVTVTGPDGEAREVSREEDFDGSRLRRVVRYRFDGERDPMYLECALYDRDALEGLLTECGFAVSEKIWGDFDGMRFSENSPRMIMVAERE